MMRAQKLAHDYQTKAQELATAGNILKQQSITLAGSAEHYQYTGRLGGGEDASGLLGWCVLV